MSLGSAAFGDIHRRRRTHSPTMPSHLGDIYLAISGFTCLPCCAGASMPPNAVNLRVGLVIKVSM